MKEGLEQRVKRVLRRGLHAPLRAGADTASPIPISSLSRKVKQSKLTYLTDGKLAKLEEVLAMIISSDIPGGFVECGVALGGSAIVIATMMPSDRTFDGYDVFSTIPPPREGRDDSRALERYSTIASGKSIGIGGDKYYGYMPDLHERVIANFASFGIQVDQGNVRLHKGDFNDTLFPVPPVAFAHIDCDWRDPVELCLERIFPVLSIGGVIILDDYNDYGGAKEATDTFLSQHSDVKVLSPEPNLVLQRTAEASQVP